MNPMLPNPMRPNRMRPKAVNQTLQQGILAHRVRAKGLHL